jgi:hypothetical protein
MSTTEFGMQDWDAVEIKSNAPSNTPRKDLYMRLEAGENRVRIITKPFQYLVHRYKPAPDAPGYGERILSSLPHGSDPVMDKTKQKPKRKWLIGVIDRKTQSYKILDMGTLIFKGIQELVRDTEDWGDPSMYDISIKVDKQGGPSGYYAVIPKAKKALSLADVELKQQVDLEDLAKRVTPPTPQQVKDRMDAIDAKYFGETAAAKPAVATPVVKKATKAATETSSNDFQSLFPDADEDDD